MIGQFRTAQYRNEYDHVEEVGSIWHRARGQYRAYPYDGTTDEWKMFSNYADARQWCIERNRAFWERLS